MNFFEHQDKARRNTKLLIFYFIAALALIVIAVNAIIYFAFLFTLQGSTSLPPTLPPLGIWKIVTPIVLGVILLGTLVKWFQLRRGGIALAEMVGARSIDTNTQDRKERRFINIVEEMSIASGVPMPKLYVMDDEAGINAFVAGIDPLDTIMVVTKGALETFNRDELQGVVGHEFSHIFNGDMRINLKLIGVLAGLLALGQIGYFMLRSGRISSGSRSSRNSGLGIVAIGAGILIIGYIGIFFGRLIKAAVSRQREYLADASSVQFTRNPIGIANALRKIQQASLNSQLKTKYAEDLSHFCFGAPFKVMFGGLLATHPPLEKRIKALDPQGVGSSKQEQPIPEKQPTQNSQIAMGFAENLPNNRVGSQQNITHDTTAALSGKAATNVTLQSEHSLIARTGTFQESQLIFAQSFLKNLPNIINQAAHDSQAAPLVIIALFIPNDNNQKALCFNIVNKHYDVNTLNKVKKYQQQLSNLNASGNMPLINLCIPALKDLSQENIKKMIDTIESFPILENRLGILKVSVLALLNQRLMHNQKNNSNRYTTFEPVATDIAKLMSMIINTQQINSALAKRIFNQTMHQFSSQTIPQPDIKKITSLELQYILTNCNQLTYTLKRKLLEACVHCLKKDNKIEILEVELITAIALALGCPIPPLV